MSVKRSFLVGALCFLATEASAEPFAILRSAYVGKDAKAAASAYTADAELVYRYDGVPEEQYKSAIEASFKTFFAQFGGDQSLDLNFRVTDKSGAKSSGIYRLRIGRDVSSFGHFETLSAADGRLQRDESRGATRDDFEEAAGPVLLAADEEILDREYYSRLTGRYVLPDGCELVITRSTVRMFVRNGCTQEWRGLSRVSGRVWTAGNRVLSDMASSTYRFAPFSNGSSPSVEIEANGKLLMAARRNAYTTQNISFHSTDGTMLSGTLYLPIGHSDKHLATVMIHGSGPQDRDGYASIIAVMADELAASGRAVLAYDKRGSGDSGGDGSRAGFDQLADDARAAVEYLRTRNDIDGSRVGLAGSSQAGWIAAKAVERGSKPFDVLLLGAAGTALTVAEQNLYNTGVTMRCSGIREGDVALALEQQRAFFAFLKDDAAAAKLDGVTAKGRLRPGLSDWLFPDSKSTDRSAGAWYIALDPGFDPLPIWRSYSGKALFLFADLDDATPTKLAVRRLAGSGAQVKVLANTQHLGLRAKDRCKGALNDLDTFSPELLKALSDFAQQ
jgi:pimeloyl-ACP methyl ester carboxylesterase